MNSHELLRLAAEALCHIKMRRLVRVERLLKAEFLLNYF